MQVINQLKIINKFFNILKIFYNLFYIQNQLIIFILIIIFLN
jgi:hypothetical protein